MQETPTSIQQLVKLLLDVTQEDEPDCRHVYNMMDVAADLKADGVDLTAALPELEQHFHNCTCCKSEFDALVKIITTE